MLRWHMARLCLGFRWFKARERDVAEVFFFVREALDSRGAFARLSFLYGCLGLDSLGIGSWQSECRSKYCLRCMVTGQPYR